MLLIVKIRLNFMGLYNYLISSFRSQFTTPFLVLCFYRVRGCGQVGVVYVLAEVRRGRRDCRGVKRRTAVKRNKQRRTQIIRTGQLQGNYYSCMRVCTCAFYLEECPQVVFNGVQVRDQFGRINRLSRRVALRRIKEIMPQ